MSLTPSFARHSLLFDYFTHIMSSNRQSTRVCFNFGGYPFFIQIGWFGRAAILLLLCVRIYVCICIYFFFSDVYICIYIVTSMLVYGAKISQTNAKDFIWNTKYMLSEDVGLLGCVSPLVRGPPGGGSPLSLPTGTQGGEESPQLGSYMFFLFLFQ